MSEDRIVQEYEGWKHGQRVQVVTEAHEDGGVCEGDEGTLYISEVGAAKYGNVHTAMDIIIDGSDEPMGVSLDPWNDIEAL